MNYRKVNFRSKTSKGYSLLELIIAISIGVILVSMITAFINDISKGYKKDVLDSKQHFYINEAFRFLEVELNGNVKKIEVTNNCLTLVKFKKQQEGQRMVLYSQLDFFNVDINKVRLNGTELQVEYMNSSTPVALLLNVEKFETEKVQDKLFITLKMKEGQYYKRCYDLKYIES